MSDDRELLKRAAKAAEIDLEWSSTVPTLWPRRKDTWDSWDPLANDGDAFRLAVKLRINVEPVYLWEGPWTENGGSLQDPYAATRRAIVRAAAELA